MPLRELKCSTCDRVLTELVSSSGYDSWKKDVELGLYEHSVNGETCGKLRLIFSLPASHSPLAEYPFTTAPWLLPPKKDSNGVLRPQRVEIHSRSQYKQVLKQNGILEPATKSEKLTMYKKKKPSALDTLDKDVGEDMSFYNKMLNNKDARRRIINESILKKGAAGI